MLYVKDPDGTYRPASEKTVYAEADMLSGYQLRKGLRISSPEDAKHAIAYRLRPKQCEVFSCLFLNSSYRILAFKEMFRGTINKATVHPREVVKEALLLNAAAVIFAHNHPSGESKPSDQDIELTNKLRDILHVVDVRVLDHLVIGEEITSFADLGLLREIPE